MRAPERRDEIHANVDSVGRPAQVAFIIGLVAIGILALIYGDFPLEYQPVPEVIPAREFLAYAAGIFMIACATGLLFRRTEATAARVLLPYLLVWLLLMLPGLVVAPHTEVAWLTFGQIAVLVAGGWVLFARVTDASPASRLRFTQGYAGTRIAQLLFAIWLVPIGLSHFVYLRETVVLIPAWLPYKTGWAYLTGAGHIAAGLGVLFSVVPRLAATMEAAMLGVITILVWVPVIAAHPTNRTDWTALIISWAITGGAWVVASSFRRQPDLAVHRPAPTDSRVSVP